MQVGDRVKTQDGKTGVVSFVWGTAIEIHLDSGGYLYRHAAALTSIYEDKTGADVVEGIEKLMQAPPLPDDKAGKAVEELESLPTDGCKYHSSPPQGPPDSIKSHTTESVPEKTWKDYNPDWLGTDVDDGVEVEVLSAVRKKVIGPNRGKGILHDIHLARHTDG